MNTECCTIESVRTVKPYFYALLVSLGVLFIYLVTFAVAFLLLLYFGVPFHKPYSPTQ